MQPIADIEAEKTLLGAMLLDKNIIPDIAEILSPEDFYHGVNGTIYKTILDLEARDITPDLVTMSNTLKNNVPASYLAQLFTSVATTANVNYYANLIKDQSLLRQLADKSRNVINRIYDNDFESAEQLLAEAENSISEITQKKTSAINHVKNDILGYLEDLENQEDTMGLKTPLRDLNLILNGLQKTDLIIIGARPSMGKTALGTEIAGRVALDGLSVAFFSIEQAKKQILNRIIIQQTIIHSDKFKSKKFSPTEWENITNTASLLNKSNLFIEDESVVTPLDIRAKCKRIKKQYGLDLVVIDYLQLIKCHKKAERRDLEITEISTSLKALAKELEVPVVALAQLSRAVEQRADKHPQMSDLRDSGGIEQAADVITFLYRDEYYNPDTEKKGIAEILIAKQREGPVGTIEVGFIKEYTKFVNLSTREG